MSARSPSWKLAVVIGVAVLVPSSALADPPASSPREAVWEFLDRVHRDDLDEATSYLTLPRDLRAQGREVARQLGAVLDRSADLDLDALSTEAEGKRDDGLGSRVEEIARIPRRHGGSDPVRLERTTGPQEGWRFTASTAARVDDWYRELQPGQLAAWMPAPLRASGPYGVAWWQWIGLVVIIAGGLILGRLLGRATTAVLCRLARRTRMQLDDDLIRSMAAPVTAFWSLFLMRLVGPLLELHPQAAVVASGAVSVAMFAVFFWAVMRGVDVAAALIARRSWARSSPSSRSLISLARQFLKVIIAVIGVVSLLSSLGYPVASLIAGLGVGGVAMALAAQKTVENLFGAFSIGVDQPIREGDFIKVEDLVGTVENIGLRSTRIRTLDRTLVTIPNGRLADMRLETFAVRDRIRLACTLGLVYSTTTEQLARITDEIRASLRSHPTIWPDSINVYVTDLAEASIKLEIMCWFATADWDEFQQIRHDLFSRFLEIVRAAGSDFAFAPRGPEATAMFDVREGREGRRDRAATQPS